MKSAVRRVGQGIVVGQDFRHLGNSVRAASFDILCDLQVKIGALSAQESVVQSLT
jgi:hypothetical protein